MIKTLSPHYVYVPLINPLTGVVCTQYTIKLYIWDGSKTAVPPTPEYEITKINASGSNGNDKINISNIASDYIEFSISNPGETDLQNSPNQVWVKYEVYYSDLTDVPGLQEVELATKGYGYFMEGENPQLPVDDILLQGDEFKVSRDGYFVMSLLANEPTVATRSLTLSTFTLDTGDVYDFTYSANFSFSQIYAFVRPIGVTEWTPLLTDAGSVEVPEDITDADFEVRLTAFDPVTSVSVNSNILTVTV